MPPGPRPTTTRLDAAIAAGGTAGADGRAELEPGLALVWHSEGDRFRLRVETAGPAAPLDATGDAPPDPLDELDVLFDGVVVPEATPSPRTVRFATPPIHDEASRAYRAVGSAAVDDRRVATIFAVFADVTDVLVGPDFVAVTIVHARDWDRLLGPLLRVVTEEFGDADPGRPTADVTTGEVTGEPEPAAWLDLRWRAGLVADEPRRLERAWTELGMLRADRPEDLDRLLTASRDTEPTRRQVAAVLLADAPLRASGRAWERLAADPSRAVRRAVVDTVAGAQREDLRALLEHALADDDAWVRWKAMRGVAALGVTTSRAAIEARAGDPDFRVRLEAARVLAAPADPAAP